MEVQHRRTCTPVKRYISREPGCKFLHHLMIRRLSTTAIATFKKESVTKFSNLAKALAVPKKWQPTAGNSFRSFAEYRLKAVNQLPLTIRTAKKGN